jgi:hypothetical protein
MDDVHLNAFSFSMDNSYLLETLLLTFQKILFQERRDLLRGEGVKINPILNRNFQNHKSQFGVGSSEFGVLKI